MYAAVLAGESRVGLEAIRRSYAVIHDYLAVMDRIRPADAILCLGCRDPAVPRRAAELYVAGVASTVVVSGGVPYGSTRCEADAFADHLRAGGVPNSRIIRDRHARNTGENVRFGVAALCASGRMPESLAVVAWPFVVRRARATLARQYPEIRVLCVPGFSAPGLRRPLTPKSARAAITQWDRLADYAAAGLIAAEPMPSDVEDAVGTLRAALDRADPGAARSVT